MPYQICPSDRVTLQAIKFGFEACPFQLPIPQAYSLVEIPPLQRQSIRSVPRSRDVFIQRNPQLKKLSREVLIAVAFSDEGLSISFMVCENAGDFIEPYLGAILRPPCTFISQEERDRLVFSDSTFIPRHSGLIAGGFCILQGAIVVGGRRIVPMLERGAWSTIIGAELVAMRQDQS